jgi:hypothetical protein
MFSVKDAGADTYLAGKPQMLKCSKHLTWFNANCVTLPDQRPKKTTGGLITLAECLRITIEYTYGIDKEAKEILLGSSPDAHPWHCRHTKEH